MPIRPAVLTFAFVVLGGLAHAAETPSTHPRLAALDANKDGAISLAEAQAPRAELFARIDRDGDGALSTAEIDAARAAMQAQREERRRGREGERLARLDANGDTRISREEFMNAPTPLFSRFDENRNGVLEAAEIAKIPQRGGRRS